MSWTSAAFESSRVSFRANLDRRFWQQTKVVDDCWVWTGSKQTLHQGRGGYGILKRFGRQIFAHRYAYELAVGPIPVGLWVLHSCDNPPCINPAHLRVGTVSDNAADAFARQRYPTGPLSAEIVRAIRASSVSPTHIARELGILPSTVRYIRQGRTYRWVDAA